MEQAHPTGCLNTKKSAKIPLSSKKMVLSLTATFTAGNFPGQIYFYTAGFELFGRCHGHLATLILSYQLFSTCNPPPPQYRPDLSPPTPPPHPGGAGVAEETEFAS